MEQVIKEGEPTPAIIDDRVLDVRTSPEVRERVNKIIKNVNKRNGSKYHKTGTTGIGFSYGDSMKRPEIIPDLTIEKVQEEIDNLKTK